MKIALIGATGFVGKAVLDELLQREHLVTAIATNLSKLSDKDRLKKAEVNVLNTNSLVEPLEGNEVVISAYNAGWKNPNLYADFLAGSQAIQSGVKQSGVKRLIVVGGAGSLFIHEKQLVDSPEFPLEWKAGATAARDYLTELKNEEELNWTFLSPAIEMHPGTSGIRRGFYRTGNDNPVFDETGKSIISVEDLAVAIADEAESAKHNRKRFTVAY